MERCLQDEKSELGLSHFETRGYPAIQRHLLITQVSHLFLARETQPAAAGGGKNPEVTLPQIHAATNALITSLPLPAPARRLWLQRTADVLTHWQQRNQQARISHVKRRHQELESAGIALKLIPQCRPG